MLSRAFIARICGKRRDRQPIVELSSSQGLTSSEKGLSSKLPRCFEFLLADLRSKYSMKAVKSSKAYALKCRSGKISRRLPGETQGFIAFKKGGYGAACATAPPPAPRSPRPRSPRTSHGFLPAPRPPRPRPLRPLRAALSPGRPGVPPATSSAARLSSAHWWHKTVSLSSGVDNLQVQWHTNLRQGGAVDPAAVDVCFKGSREEVRHLGGRRRLSAVQDVENAAGNRRSEVIWGPTGGGERLALGKQK